MRWWLASVRTPNLATRPFSNERLPALLMGLALVGILALSVKHAFVLGRLLPSRTAAVEGEVRSLEKELLELRAEVGSLPRAKPEPSAVAEWETIRSLVDRRAFSWARLLARLEHVLPPNVKLASIAPNVKDGQMTLDMGAIGRTITDGFGFLKVLQASEDFGDVIPSSVSDVSGAGGGGEIHYTMRYTPVAPVPGKPAPQEAASEPADEPAAEDPQ